MEQKPVQSMHIEQPAPAQSPQPACAAQPVHKTTIGGQAVIEGVMMRGPEKTCVAVRKPDGEIELRELNVSQKKSVWKKIPIVRGVYNFGASLAVGFKALNLSAEVSMTEEVSEPTKFDRFLDEKLGDKAAGVITTFTIVVAVLLALALFILLPYYLARGIEWVFRTELGFWFFLAEGLVRILIFLLYIVLVSRMPDIKRLFQYHGAEHKTVHCYEHAEALEVENVRRYSCLHKRCGTNLLLIVMILSILIFSIIQVQNPILRIVLRILLLPVVAGVSYEALKLIGRYDNWFTRAVSAPGMLLQKLTTSEPDDGQMEVAIAALSAVTTGDRADDAW